MKAWSEPVVLPTFEPRPPSRYPMFLDRRVYQGSSGRVYPLPFVDRIAEDPVRRAWQAVHLQNELLRVMVLPELGGRIHLLRDLTTGYDLLYRQDVVKPALVGLAGPWASGGLELNWPQHHRPATFMPTEVALEEEPDGAVTAWFSDHDPMSRMKGMHGVRLRPGEARMELRVRLHNRTPLTQTFLWWANAAVEAHEDYQSFFPPDVRQVADHARRAVASYPRCRGSYYGVDYGRRGREGVPPEERPRQFAPRPGRPPDDLTWYANIPVPTSYMALGSRQDFLGGYDHAAGVGVVIVADHRIAPGKKQWTWGNQEFGYAWDRNLTEPDERGRHRPYLELMSGVFTDNQPDFSFLAPGETRTFTQVYYPLHRIGPAQAADDRAALSFTVRDGRARVGVSAAVPLPGAVVRVTRGAAELLRWAFDLRPGKPFLAEAELPAGAAEAELRAAVEAGGAEVLAFAPGAVVAAESLSAAAEPPLPGALPSADELYLTGLHLEQYRHATREPVAYWEEALRRDPLDCRCNTAMGLWRLRRGQAAEAEGHLRKAIERLTRWNANPRDGEPFHALGLALRALGRDAEAEDAFAKGTWSGAWAGPCHRALAELCCARGDWAAARDHLARALRRDADDLGARGLLVMVLRRLGQEEEARAELREALAQDPLDAWARHLDGRTPRDPQLRLDLAHDLARAGLRREALELLLREDRERGGGAEPVLRYTAAWLAEGLGEGEAAARERAAAAAAAPDLCFPWRVEEIAILERAAADPGDARAPGYLGCLLHARGRREEAIGRWERAVERDPSDAVSWRNLGVARFNVRRDPAGAREAYERAMRAAPGDARLLYERDQLWKRTGARPAERLAELAAHRELVELRDDLCVELCALLLQAGRPEEALARLLSRRFQPWEGGEGTALEQHTRARLSIARALLGRGDGEGACLHLEAALSPPASLGEARHPLASAADVHHALGLALELVGDQAGAVRQLELAAGARGDFQGMSVRSFSEQTYWSALALVRLGRAAEGEALLRELERHARALLAAEARVDYFATSLPAMLLFEDDLQRRQEVSARVMLGQARLGLGDRAGAGRELLEALRLDPSCTPAAELLREPGTGTGLAPG